MNVVLTSFQNVWKVILCQPLFASCAASKWPKYVNAGKVNAHRLMAYSALVKLDCKELGRAQECPFFRLLVLFPTTLLDTSFCI